MFKHIINLICIVLCFAGCKVLTTVSRSPNKHVQTWPVIDPNDYGIHIVKDPNGTINYTWNRDLVCRDCPDKYTLVMPYWGGDWLLKNIPSVQGQLNGTSYPVILDTGNPLGVFITDIHINKHKLPVYFFNPENKSTSAGLAIADLTLDKLQFDDYPCILVNYHARINFLGLSTGWIEKAVIFPMDLMANFSWIRFDQVQREVSISTESFAPEDESQWVTFPFEITGRQIRVPVELEGIPVRLFLDTGGGFQLNLHKNVIGQLFEKRPDFQKSRKKKWVSLTPYMYGRINELSFTAKRIQLGDTVLKNASISYNDGVADPNAFPYEGTMGIDLFKKTVMVLDFEKKLIWAKKAKGSLFEP